MVFFIEKKKHSQMGPENTMPSEINQVEKDTHRNSIDWWLPGAEGWRNGQ